jgi:hypothetical protein
MGLEYPDFQEAVAALEGLQGAAVVVDLQVAVVDLQEAAAVDLQEEAVAAVDLQAVAVVVGLQEAVAPPDQSPSVCKGPASTEEPTAASRGTCLWSFLETNPKVTNS